MLILIKKNCIGKSNGRRLYTVLRLDHRLRLWAPISASCSISMVAELLVYSSDKHFYFNFLHQWPILHWQQQVSVKLVN